MQNVHFTPPQLSQFLGVNPSTIKRWVDKGFINAEITPGGHRRITKKEVERFLKEHPRYAPHSYIARHVDTSVSPDDASRYYRLLYKREYVKGRNEITRLLMAGAHLEEVLDDIIRPTLIKIGVEWTEGNIDITDEHRMSFVTRSHLEFIGTMIPEPRRDAPTVVLSCIPNERHEIPLIMISLLLKKYGLRSETLGINVPGVELAREIETVRPAFIGISKLFSKNSVGESYCSVISAATKRVDGTILLGGSGWTESEIGTFTRSAKRVRAVPNIKSLLEVIRAHRELLKSA